MADTWRQGTEPEILGIFNPKISIFDQKRGYVNVSFFFQDTRYKKS